MIKINCSIKPVKSMGFGLDLVYMFLLYLYLLIENIFLIYAPVFVYLILIRYLEYLYYHLY